MSPAVTAVITTHARPQFIEDALASVCAETFRDIECVVVDDGGAYEPSNAAWGIDIRVLKGSQLGVAAARNLGLADARGEYVIFLDDDDLALPHRITTLLGAAKRFNADLCYGMTSRVIAGSTRTLPPVPTAVISTGSAGFCDVLTCAPHVNAVLVRTSTMRSIGGFDVEARDFDDVSAWIRLADRNIVMWSVPDVVAEWRIHGNGLSGAILRTRAMKSRLLALFDHLQGHLSRDNKRAVAEARLVVSSSEIETYDDYVAAMSAARATLHSAGTCFGSRLLAHEAPLWSDPAGPVAVR